VRGRFLVVIEVPVVMSILLNRFAFCRHYKRYQYFTSPASSKSKLKLTIGQVGNGYIVAMACGSQFRQ
jgi:hypothetical protein